MAHSVTLRKRRTGNWYAAADGSGKTIPDGSGDEYDDDPDDDDSDDSDDDGSPDEDPLKRANAEAKRRRIENRGLRLEVAVRDAIADLELSKTQRKYVLKFFDPSAIQFENGKPTGVEDAVKALVDECNSEFGTDSTLPKNLPSQGSKGNRDKNKGGSPSREDLMRRYPALRR